MTKDSADDLFGFEDTSAEESSDPVVEDVAETVAPDHQRAGISRRRSAIRDNGGGRGH